METIYGFYSLYYLMPHNYNLKTYTLQITQKSGNNSSEFMKGGLIISFQDSTKITKVLHQVVLFLSCIARSIHR